MQTNRYRLLFIEEDPDVITEIQALLASEGTPGFELKIAHRLDEGLERASKEATDAVLLSLPRPDDPGLTALSKATDRAPRLPILIIAPAEDDEQALECLRMGAQEFIGLDRLDRASFARTIRGAIERKRAAEAEKDLKRQLVSALAHDVQNPLVVINVNAQVLTSRIEPSDQPNQSLELLQLIQDNVRRINFLIKSFLDISKSEAVKVESVREPLQLNHVIRELCHHQAGELILRQITLTLDLDNKLPPILGNEAELERALWNLVSNAVKYTPMGGAVTLSSYVEGESVCVSVKDTGMGIPEQDLAALFEEFHRHRGATRFRGIGLGLFIAKNLVQAHGGNVDVKSKVGKGSTFTVRLPRASAETAGPKR